MKRVYPLLSLGLFLLAMGCNPNGRLNILRNGGEKPPLSQQDVPTVAALVNYMEENSQKVQSLRCTNVSLTAQSGLIPITVPAQMVCQQPKNFRMAAQTLGQTEVDLGSNDQEFWFWIKRAEPPPGMKGPPPQFHCTYQALKEGKVRYLPFPFQPDWIMEALGMGQYGPATRYEQLVVGAENLKLIEKTRSPQGTAVRKVTVFNRRKAIGNNPQITDYLLEDEATGKLICAAHVSEVQYDPKGGVFPRRLELSWPEQKLKLGMELNGVTVNPTPSPNAFVRQPMVGIPSFDLAAGRVDGMPNSIQRTQLLQQPR